jgi:trehalose/maltose transport system substrate-binding protein
VKRRIILLAAAGALVLAVIASLAASIGVASAGTARATAPAAATAAAYPAPKVPNAASIKSRYGGQSITFIGDSVGGSHNRDVALAKRFSQDTGINVKVVPHPTASDASYSQIARVFSSKSSSFDVAMLDVLWPGAFAPYLVDLKPKLGKEAKQHTPGLIKNNTVGGKLVAMPWFGDFGILYYRSDLLKKYGYNSPPTTWTQLFAMAKKIQDGEQQANDKFSGFVFQGNSYEGLTCDALEWYQSSGAGGFIDNGKVTINNKKGAAVLDQFRAQIGNITPRDVTTYQEGEAHTAFVEGNAAFMRNWPYAYSIGQDPKSSKIVGKFSVTVLPHNPGGTSVGTVGGWQLGVNKYSKRVDASIEFVRYMTSAPVQKFNAITNTNVPTIPSVAKDPAVVKVNPYLKPAIANVARVARPSTALGAHYNEGSKAIYQGINQILNGRSASSVLPSIESKLNRILR